MSAAEVRTESVEDLPDEFIECRDLGHSWRTVSKGRAKGGIEIIRFSACRSCKSLRKDRFHRFRGIVTSRSYQYSAGYLLAGGGVGRGRAAFRAEMVRRLDESDLPEWGDDVSWDVVPKGARRKRNR